MTRRPDNADGNLIVRGTLSFCSQLQCSLPSSRTADCSRSWLINIGERKKCTLTSSDAVVVLFPHSVTLTVDGVPARLQSCHPPVHPSRLPLGRVTVTLICQSLGGCGTHSGSATLYREGETQRTIAPSRVERVCQNAMDPFNLRHSLRALTHLHGMLGIVEQHGQGRGHEALQLLDGGIRKVGLTASRSMLARLPGVQVVRDGGGARAGKRPKVLSHASALRRRRFPAAIRPLGHAEQRAVRRGLLQERPDAHVVSYLRLLVLSGPARGVIGTPALHSCEIHTRWGARTSNRVWPEVRTCRQVCKFILKKLSI